MKFVNAKFGEISCTEEQVMRFPDGLLGRKDCTQFVVVDDELTSPFQWLVSVDDPAVAVSVLDPAVVLDGNATDQALAEGTTTFVVATAGEGGVAWWLDLRHPVIIRHNIRMGEQVTLDDTALPDRFPIEVQQADQGA